MTQSNDNLIGQLQGMFSIFRKEIKEDITELKESMSERATKDDVRRLEYELNLTKADIELLKDANNGLSTFVAIKKNWWRIGIILSLLSGTVLGGYQAIKQAREAPASYEKVVKR